MIVVTVKEAAKFGQLHVPKWLHRNFNERTLWGGLGLFLDVANNHLENSAAADGHLQVVRWLHNTRAEGRTVAATGVTAKKRGGHFAVLKWLQQHRREGCTPSVTDNAAGIGSLDIIQWLETQCTLGCASQALLNVGLVTVVNPHWSRRSL